MDAVQPKPAGLTHDTAARLLAITPADLERLVSAGHIRRGDRNTYSPQILVADYLQHLRETDDRHPTQPEAAAHLDLSDRTVRELEDKLNLPTDYSLKQLRVAYIRHLREIAAGRASTADKALDLAAERAALAREQRIGQAMKNAVARGEYAPIGLLADVLSAAASGVVDRFDQLDGALKKACPDLPDDARQALHKVIASARNEWVRATASLVAARLDETTEEGDGADDLAADDEAASE